MNTLKQIVINRRSRKGKAAKITKDGAYWLPLNVKIKSAGGNGLGQDAPDLGYYLTVRHYRSGDLRAYIVRQSWHQNYGTQDIACRCDDVLESTTVEEVITLCKRHEIKSDYLYESEKVEVTEAGEKRLVEQLPEMLFSVPSPDDEVPK